MLEKFNIINNTGEMSPNEVPVKRLSVFLAIVESVIEFIAAVLVVLLQFDKIEVWFVKTFFMYPEIARISEEGFAELIGNIKKYFLLFCIGILFAIFVGRAIDILRNYLLAYYTRSYGRKEMSVVWGDTLSGVAAAAILAATYVHLADVYAKTAVLWLYIILAVVVVGYFVATRVYGSMLYWTGADLERTAPKNA